MAALLFAHMKMQGLHVELVREYVKLWAWSGKQVRPTDQIYLLGKQSAYESLLYGKVDYIVTDSPVMLAGAYAEWHNGEAGSYVTAAANSYYNVSASDGTVRYLDYVLHRQEMGRHSPSSTDRKHKRPKRPAYTRWRLWAKALGEKASPCDRESDRVAVIRTLIFTTYLATNIFIVAGVIRHWNDENYDQRDQSIGDARALRRDLHGTEAALGDVCLLLSGGRPGAYHISDSGDLRCRDAILPQRPPGGVGR